MAERAAKQLELNKSELPNSITEVIATLSRAGFDAYIVGGGVRDTLLGLRPKDFDAVTDAKPHEIKDVFGKRCRIIGRRFQLAHVYSGRELIEVATFRGPPTSNTSTNQDGMILRDNVWGDIKQDFARRDFSINALYYQPLKGVVHDFCGALEDIDNKVIRLLGHAPVRIEEDPVRLLRALRFKAKLGFEFDKELSEQFHDNNWALLEQISPHRLYDETQKMFTGGYLVPLLPLLFESGAIDHLVIYPPSEPSPLVQQVAINTDKRIAAGKSINPAFFYAALLWENYLHQLEKAKNRNMPFAEAQMHAAAKVIDRQRIKTAIPKFAEQFIRDIWILQPKLAAPRTKQIVALSEHPRFRAGFDFLLLREQCGDSDHPLSESTNGMGDWWQTYQTLSEKEQQQAINGFDENLRRGAHKRGRQRQKSKNTHDKQQPEQQPMDVVEVQVPSKRRRRNSNDDTQNHAQNNAKQSAKKHDRSKPSQQQAAQDLEELVQLQQLSLANNANANKASAKPAPLFVIEQEKVVPPLIKQLETEPSQSSKGRQASASKKSAKHADSQQKIDKAAKAAEVKDTRQPVPPRSPSLVTNSSEPVPYKRRRRQPSDEMQTANHAKASHKNSTPDQVTTKDQSVAEAPQPDKEASKTAKGAKSAKNTASADNANVKANAKTNINTNTKTNTSVTKATGKLALPNQGPIPAKRRRRQPSTDSA